MRIGYRYLNANRPGFGDMNILRDVFEESQGTRVGKMKKITAAVSQYHHTLFVLNSFFKKLPTDSPG